jgi:hypothetical protein
MMSMGQPYAVLDCFQKPVALVLLNTNGQVSVACYCFQSILMAEAIARKQTTQNTIGAAAP